MSIINNNYLTLNNKRIKYSLVDFSGNTYRVSLENKSIIDKSAVIKIENGKESVISKIFNIFKMKGAW